MRLKTSKLKRAVAVLAATCTLGTCCVAGSIAWAEPEQNGGANTANIKAGQTTSITIHKYDGGVSTTKATGTTQTVSGRNAVKGVEFKVCKVTLATGNTEDEKKIDLSTAEGWKRIEDIQKLDPASKKAASFLEGEGHKFTTTDCKTQTTGDDGSTKFEGLAESLYYVEESDTKDAQIKDGDKWKSVTVTGKVDPFFITTPCLTGLRIHGNGCSTSMCIQRMIPVTTFLPRRQRIQPSFMLLMTEVLSFHGIFLFL